MITVTVDSKPVADLLATLSRRMSDLSPAMASVGQELNSRISARFETRSDPLGRPWAPWAKSTRDAYPRDGRGQLLERHGAMLQSLNFSTDKTSVRVGFGAVASKGGNVYAAYHEWGTKHMPRRGLLFADPDAGTLAPADEAAVLDIIGTFLTDSL
ncbi:MAG: phage virion morphogenesis protein [Gammaproteobacteria bacterium]|nr:phage virion morphogenesis protein [Gammaproteobacteria bacterium]